MEVNTINKGGRYNKAFYKTTHVRIPVELKELVQSLSNDYKLTGNVPSLEPMPVSQPNSRKKKRSH